MVEVSVREAARRLGVSEQRTRQMVREQELVGRQINGHTWLLDAASVQDRVRSEIGRGRPWADQTVAAIVTALSDGFRIDAKSAMRLRRTEVEQIARKVAQIFTVRRFNARRRDIVHEHLALTGESAIEAIGARLVGQSRVLHGYVHGIDFGSLIDDAGLIEDGEGNVEIYTLRSGFTGSATDWTVGARGYARSALIAVDCVRSPQSRVRSAGLRALEGMRSRWLETNI
jgi:excisionase family DNA binding protein